jgi:allantoicase
LASFTDLVDLASERLGGSVLIANDEFFAPKESLLKPGKPEWREGAFTERGKWMDGWETRRRRSPGHDWAIIRLGAPGVVRGVVIDTTWFTGNYPERASIDATTVEGTPSAEWLAGSEVQWAPLLVETQLEGNTTNEHEADSKRRVTHLRFNIFPDGGVARLPTSRQAQGTHLMTFRTSFDTSIAHTKRSSVTFTSSAPPAKARKRCSALREHEWTMILRQSCASRQKNSGRSCTSG